MPRPGTDHFAGFARDVQGQNAYVRRMEVALDNGDLRRSDIVRVYEGAFLLFHTSLERSLEELFMGVLMRRIVVTGAGIRPLVDIRSEVVARRAVCGERKYVDWLPYDMTRRRARAFLAGGKPFDRPTGLDEAAFRRASVLRNAIAHGGAHSMRAFRNTFQLDGLPAAQQRPAGFLRGRHAAGQTRFEFTLAECSRVLDRLCE